MGYSSFFVFVMRTFCRDKIKFPLIFVTPLIKERENSFTFLI